MAGHHKKWARGARHIGAFRITFEENHIQLSYAFKDKTAYIKEPYTIESEMPSAIILRVGDLPNARKYRLTIEENGIWIEGDTRVWALMRKGSTKD